MKPDQKKLWAMLSRVWHGPLYQYPAPVCGSVFFYDTLKNRTALVRYSAAMCLCILTFTLLSSPALASTANDIFGQTSPIRKLVAFMTGPFAFLVVIVGIVIMGSMLIFGNDLSGFGRRVLLLVLGGGLVLGSIQVVSKLFNAGRPAGAIYAPSDIPNDIPLGGADRLFVHIVSPTPIEDPETEQGAEQ